MKQVNLHRSRRRRPFRLVPVPGVVLIVGSGCASAGKLAEYDFRDRTVGVVSLGSPRPEILTDAVLDVNLSNPLQAALRIGADVVKEVEASRARGRLDTAAVEADVPGRRIWKGKVTEREAITPALVGGVGSSWQEQAAVNDLITAAGLASLSPEAMVRMLEGLADFSADRILRSFRRGLEKNRG